MEASEELFPNYKVGGLLDFPDPWYLRSIPLCYFPPVTLYVKNFIC